MSRRFLNFARLTVPHAREFAIIGAAYGIYMLIRTLLIIDTPVVPFKNAMTIVSLEKALGINWEPSLQAWVIQNIHEAVIVLNWVYIFAFYPIISIASIYLYARHRRHYHYYRPIILLSFGLALISFAVFPLAPPRMLGGEFIDTIREYGPGFYNSTQVGAAYNAFAAMPSLHFGWSAAFGVIFFRSGNKVLRLLGIAYPSLMLLAIVVTGEHFFADAIGGAFVMLTAFAIVLGWRRFRTDRASVPLRNLLRPSTAG